MLSMFTRGRTGFLGLGTIGIALILCGCGKASAPAPTPTPWLPTATPKVVASATAPNVTPSGTQGASTPGTGGPEVSFKNDIEPIFQAHCAACHIQQQLGGLYLGNYNGLVKGGNVVPGPIFVAGDHKASILWQIVQPNGPWPGGNRMPLGGPYLDDASIATIATWIDQGAKDN